MNTKRPEFDPTSEKHHFALLIKFVDPGCTLELQIEESDGRVTRLTSTENAVHDRAQFKAAVVEAFTRTLDKFGI